jgi:hypothetical protein
MESLHESIRRVINEDPTYTGLNNPMSSGNFGKYSPSNRSAEVPVGYGQERYNYPQYTSVSGTYPRQLRNPSIGAPVDTRSPGYRRGTLRRNPNTNRSPYSYSNLNSLNRTPGPGYRSGEAGDQGGNNWGGGDWLANWLNQQSGNYSGSRLSGGLNNPGWGG